MQKDQHVGHRAMWGGLLLLITLISLCGCSPSAKSEKEIIADLRQSPAFISETVKIEKCEIVKRQTNKDSKSDLVYLTVYVNEDDLTCELSYVMEYILYDEGWILESAVRDYDGVWNLGGLSNDRILEDIQKNDPFFNQCTGLTITEHKIEGPSASDDYFEQCVRVSISAENDQIMYQPSYLMYYTIKGSSWENEIFSIESDYLKPMNIPDEKCIEAIGESLTCLKEYDSYECFVVPSDLENCTATIYYRAYKKYELGTENYYVLVPLTFYRSLDEELPAWHYDENKVKIDFNNVDWNIEGVWTSEGSYRDDGFSRWVNWNVWLSISDISYTESKEEFLAKVSCDATYSEDNDESYYGLIPKHSSHQCKTQDAVIVTIRRGEQGGYSFYIPEQAWGISNFSIELEPDNTGWSGICWKFSLWSVGLPEPQLTRAAT